MNFSSYRSEYNKNEKRFIRISFITICSLFLLILAGGIVRSTGSGMGCPDWPKCFDQWVPPTDVSQLPENYREQYLEKRLHKNERFATLLQKIGDTETAQAIRNDESIKNTEEFNVANTYTEYVNRLIGALTGLFMLIMLFYSIPLMKQHLRVFLLSTVILILTFFQAWFGSIVVTTNLLAWTITVHMVLAIIILALVIYTYSVVKYKYLEPVKVSIPNLRIASVITWISLALTMLQIVWGTELRESIDYYADFWKGTNRGAWVELTGFIFKLHRSFSIILMLLLIYSTWYIRIHFGAIKRLRRFSSAAILILIVQIASGIILANFALPQGLQPVHLLLSTLLIGALVMQIIMINIYKRNIALDLIS
jgi:cytochrome c oxidase assembly protein subunit 15